MGAWDDERRLIEGKNLAIRVVATHPDNRLCAGDQFFHPIIEFDDFDPRHRLSFAKQLAPLSRRHVGPQYDEGPVLKSGILLIGVEHVVNEIGSITAAARGYQDIILLRPAAWQLGRENMARQEADETHPRPDRCGYFKTGERVVEIRRAVHPDAVIKQVDLAQYIALPPLRLKKVRRVHNFAESKDQGCSSCLQIRERFFQFAAQTHRFLVDDEDIGLKSLRGIANDRLTKLEGFVEIHVTIKGGIF